MDKIYFDNAASTRAYDEVVTTIGEVMKDNYANPSSIHSMGQSAASYVEEARDLCAAAINAKPSEIVFTSGGTESDNMAIIGYCRKNSSKGRHVITGNIEHPAVLNSFERLKTEGFEVDCAACDGDGIVRAETIKRLMREDTILVSLMHANNEIGTIQPVNEVGALCRQNNTAFHCDAVQSFCKLKIDVSEMNADMLSVSAHKCHGPKGVGFLYVRTGIALEGVIYGGGQEKSMRSGTVNAPLIAGMSRAIEINMREHQKDKELISRMRDHLIYRIKNEIEGASLNGSMEKRLYENANFSFEGVASDKLLYALDINGVCISAGSACSAGTIEPSHVIKALNKDISNASVRFSLSKFNTTDQVDSCVDILKSVLYKLRNK